MNNNRGFTLLEILVSIALASLLLSSIYGIFTASSDAKERVEKRANALHLARVMNDRIDRELLGLSLSEDTTKEILAGGKNERGEPYLRFLTSSSGSPQAGMHWVSYRLAADQDNRMTLWRSEKGGNEQADAAEERLAQGIENLSFSFYNGTSWKQEWSSLTDGRPVLMQAEIELEDLDNESPLVCVFSLSQSGRTNVAQ